MKIRLTVLLTFFLCICNSHLRHVAYFSSLSEMRILMNGNLYVIFRGFASATVRAEGMINIFGVILAFIMLIKKPDKLIKSLSFTALFSVAAFTFVAVSYINGVDVSALTTSFIRMAVHFAFLEYSIRNRRCGLVLKGMAAAYSFLLILNTICFLAYPDGIFVDQAYTRYNLLGMDNQVTPFLLESFFVGMLYMEVTGDRKGILLSGLSVLNVFFLESGNAIVTMALFCIYSIIFYDSKLRKLVTGKALLLMYIVISVLLLSFNLSSFTVDVAEMLFQKGGTVAARFTIWTKALLQIRDRFLIGYGYGHKVIAHYYSHNGILELFLLGGVVLAGAYIPMIVSCVKAASRYSKSKIGAFTFFSLVVLLCANILEAFLFDVYQIEFLLLVNVTGVLIKNAQPTVSRKKIKIITSASMRGPSAL